MNNHDSIRPYVGISGITSPETQNKLETVAREAGLFENNRILALGVKATHKTQFLDIENKHGNEWYPVGENEFRNALSHSKLNADTIAVAQTYLDINRVNDGNYRKEFVERIKRRGEAWLQAIQFDMLPWHNDSKMLDFIEHLKTTDTSDIKIFLQCHENAMNDLGPKGVVDRLGHYAIYVDYILFDSSHGTGKELDVTRLDNYLYEASSNLDTSRTGLAVAGGLDEKNVKNYLPSLLSKYPKLSWDAEGKLHPNNSYGKRPLDLSLAIEYIKASSDIIANNSK